MRTRSQPVSPGGFVSLDDVPRRRHNTRSVSAQPQEAESDQQTESQTVEAAKSKPAPKNRKARAKSTRGKKKIARRPTGTPEPEQQDAADIAAENNRDSQEQNVKKVEQPPVTIEEEHLETNITGPAVETRHPADQLQDVEIIVTTPVETELHAGSPGVNVEAPLMRMGRPAPLMQHVENVIRSEIEFRAVSPGVDVGVPVIEMDQPDDLMQDVGHVEVFPNAFQEQHVEFPGPSADEIAAEQSREDHEMQDAEFASAIPSIEEPHAVFPPFETSDVESATGIGAALERELYLFASGLSASALPVSVLPTSSLSASALPVSVLPTSSLSASASSATALPAPELSTSELSAFAPHRRDAVPTGVAGITRPIRRQLLRPQVCEKFRRLRHWISERWPAYQQYVPDVNPRWPLNPIIVGFRINQGNSLLEDIEVLTVGPVRDISRRIHRTSPRRPIRASSTHSQHATEGSSVLRPRQATPIRRSRSSYSTISQSRRTEASGRIDRTLYRLPDLLSQNESEGEAPVLDHQEVVETENTVPVIANPTTPETAPPRAPMTAPAAAPDPAPAPAPAAGPAASPSWSRWIFNNVSRRWTTVRERFGTRTAGEIHPDVEQAAAPAAPTPPAETTAPTAPAVSAEASAPTPAEIVSSQRHSFRPRRLSSLLPPRPSTSRRRRSVTSSTPRVVPAAPPAPPAPRRSSRPYDLFPAGFSQELLDRCYARGTNPHAARASQSTQAAETATPVKEDQSLKRKRHEPEKIPNPKGCSYGMDMEYFDFTDEEWDEEEKRLAAEAAKDAAGPATKKQRVDQPQQQRRRVATRPTTSVAPLSSVSPSRRPGFVPNRRGTYQAPDLSPIESSGLYGTDSSPIPQAQAPQAQIPQGPPGSMPTTHGTFQTPHLSSLGDNGPSPLPATPEPHGTTRGRHTFETPYSSSSPEGEDPTSVRTPTGSTQRGRNTFETPYSPDSPSYEAGWSPSPPLDTPTRLLPSPVLRRRQLCLALQAIGRDESRRASGKSCVITDEELFCDTRVMSVFGNPYIPRVPGWKTPLQIRRELGPQIRKGLGMKPKPLYCVYPDGTFRRYSDTEDTPLYRVRRDGTTEMHRSYRTAADKDLEVTAPRAEKDAESREPAAAPAVVANNREAPAAVAHTHADADAAVKDPSPLTRARTKAEQFKPKTPSRLRESYRFSSSTSSMSVDSPSFMGAFTGTPSHLSAVTSAPSLFSDEMSIDSTLDHLTTADDINWLHEICPHGDLSQLLWPEPASLTETFEIDPAAAAIVGQNWAGKKEGEAVAAWRSMFEDFQGGDLDL